MGNSIGSINEQMWEMAKGTMNLGSIKMSWDLTGGLTKKQFMNRWNKQKPNAHGIQKNGRVIIPSLGIY